MTSFRYFCLSLLLLSLFPSCEEGKSLLFVGSYTDKIASDGIKVYEFDSKSGITKEVFVLSGITNPSFLRLSSNGKVLYTISDSQLETDGFLSSYSVDPKNGHLELISKETCLGRNPVHIDISPGQNLLSVSNYTDPSLSLYQIDEQGHFGPAVQHFKYIDSSIVRGRQDEAHIHSSTFSRDGKFLYAHDLGGDKIRTYLVNDTINDLAVKDIKVEAGAGPRHFTFDQDGDYGYLLCELSGSIHAFSVEGKSGALKLIEQYPTYGQNQDIYRAADIHFAPSGKFLYVSNRGPEENTIAVFKKESNGKLSFVQRVESGGDHPRNFAIDQKGELLFIGNTFSNKLVIRSLDPGSGLIGEILNEIDFPNVSSIQTFHY